MQRIIYEYGYLCFDSDRNLSLGQMIIQASQSEYFWHIIIGIGFHCIFWCDWIPSVIIKMWIDIIYAYILT